MKYLQAFFKLGTLRLIGAFALLAAQQSTHAALTVTMASSVSVKRGDVIVVPATIQNTGASTVYVNGDAITAALNSAGITLPAYDLFADDSPFAKNAPLTLNAGQQWTGNLFKLTIGIDSPTQTYGVTFSVKGGSTSTQFTSIGSGTIALTVNDDPPTGPPSVPTGLTGTVPSISQINLSWFDTAGDADSFSVERSADGGTSWNVLGVVLSNQFTFTDSTAQVSGSYKYRVRAHNNLSGGAYSAYSNLFSVVTFGGGGGGGTGDGLTGNYYNDANGNHYVGPPVLVRIDPKVDFVWGVGVTPGPGVGTNGEYFSVRWVGFVQPQYTETYTFYTNTDDGAALWVNGQQLVNDPTSHGATEFSGSIQLTAGQFYTIEMDYFQGSGGAEAHLSWSSPSVPKQIIPQARLNSSAGASAPTGLTAVPASASQINLSWSASLGNPAGYILQRKLGPNGVYSTVAYVGGNTLAFQDTQLASAVNYVYRIQATNSGYSTEASAVTLGPPLAPTSLTATAASPTQVNLTWGDLSGGAATYLVERSSNGGASWTQIQSVAASTLSYSDTTATANTTYKYRVRTVNSYLGGSYSAYTNIYTVVTPASSPNGDGLLGTYYSDSGSHLTGTPALTRIDPTINFAYNPGTPGYGNGTNISVRWTGSLVAQYSETYTFYTESDDGVRLYIDGNLIVTNWTDHGVTENTGTAPLVAGQTYSIQLEFYQGGGPGAIQLLWSSASTPKQIIPQSQLYSGTGLSTPGNFQAAAVSTTRIDLSWTSASTNAQGFVIQRQDGPGAAFQQVATIGLAPTTFQDAGLNPGTQYAYKIRSFNTGGNSGVAIVTTATLADPPTGLAVTPATGKANLSWVPPVYIGNSSDLTFNIYRGDTSGGETKVANGIAGNGYTDSGLQDGHTYYYKVDATDLGGEGALSTEVSLAPHYVLSDFFSQYAVGDLLADPSGDGVTNLMAYALNLNPLHSNAANLPVGQIANGYLTLTFTQRTLATDVTYTVQVSTDLANWYSGAGHVTLVSVTPIDANTQQVKVKANDSVSSGLPQFIRLQVRH